MSATAGLIWENVLAVGTLLRATARGEYGQTLAEYSLIITVIAVGVVVSSMILFRVALGGAFDSATDCISGATC